MTSSSAKPTMYVSLGPERWVGAQYLIDIRIDSVLVAIGSDDLSEPLLGDGGSHGQGRSGTKLALRPTTGIAHEHHTDVNRTN